MPRGRKDVYKSSPVYQGLTQELPEGKAAKYAAFIQHVYSWPAVPRDDIPALERRFEEYVNLCSDFDIKIGNQGAYLALGITKDIVYEWEHQRSGSLQQHEFIKKVKAFCAFNREVMMQDGQINPVTGIFWQKNYDGMKDVQDVVVTPANPLGDIQDIEDITKRLPD